jgi:anti-sigma factor RsiW
MSEDWHVKISGYLDDELTPEERVAFERQVARDPDLARELEAMRAMKEVTSGMRLRDLPDQVWDHYWEGTYNRIERGIGWLLLSIGAIVLLAGGLYELALALLRDTVDPWWVRLAVGAVSGGLAVLLISVIRERLFMFKRDPYREVKR